ncbi:YafY family protein [Apibacter sp. HY039]|uniref:helix-turn-helix transcriptional regulator n=1 Tax=Apibacter sp. HY039 TaxID=2501476 RepID=UPI000FEC1A1E|nr:WYL domain-containing protein [Apibacter sp. HY039]
MATNKSALIRYRTIDNCLRNPYRKWTLEDLIDKVSDALYEYEGITTGVSKRTIQADIQLMRSDKLGYNAPIIVKERKYYVYDDPEYSITNSPITDADMGKMKEIVAVLKQLNGFQYFDEMSEMIARLENSLYKTEDKKQEFIQFEGNQRLRGIKYITPIYHAIVNKKPLLINYKSFKAIQARQSVYYPYLLKEYRNRWFLVSKQKSGKFLYNLALDRMEEVYELAAEPYVEYEGVDFNRYFDEVIGVSKTEKDRAQKVILWFNKDNAPYVITKPLHSSQQIVKNEEDGGIVIRIDVVLNFELEREILGFGDTVKVLSPRLLQKKIRKKLLSASQLYTEAETKSDD